MQRAIEIARLAEGRVAPNPLVGCVIVHHNQIVGEGYHAFFGGPHAEVNAINSVENKSLLSESTLFVTLEPCAHHGKTPPCSDLIVAMGIPRVVVGCEDPFEAVNGKGIKRLQDAGIEVVVGVLREECRHLNRRFFAFHEKKRPFVVLKWAQSADGFIDINRADGRLGSFSISHPDTKELVHTWRAEEAAILIGKNTLLTDNPSLTVREVMGKNPIRLVLSSSRVDLQDKELGNHAAPTWVLTNNASELQGHVRYLACGDVHHLDKVLDLLYRENVLSVLVEGGAHTLQSFIDAGLWEEARVIVGAAHLNDGLLAPRLVGDCLQQQQSATDVIYYYRNPRD